jgi:lipoprotein-releasing system permease protein
MIQGMLLGGVSVALGLLIGLGVCWGQITFQWVQFNMAEGFLVPALPVEVALTDVIAVAVVGFVLAAVAALYPAHRAAQTRIADAVRVE